MGRRRWGRKGGNVRIAIPLWMGKYMPAVRRVLGPPSKNKTSADCHAKNYTDTLTHTETNKHTEMIFKTHSFDILVNDNLFACNKFSTSLTYNAITCFVIIITLHFVNLPLRHFVGAFGKWLGEGWLGGCCLIWTEWFEVDWMFHFIWMAYALVSPIFTFHQNVGAMFSYKTNLGNKY